MIPAALPLLARRAGRLVVSEDGSASIWSIFWMTMMMIVSGFTLDVSNAYRVRALLQATADASALAAVRALPDAEAARTVAMDLAQVNMPVSGNGTVVLPSMVQIGAWDRETNTFEAGATPYDAVKVVAARGNGAGLDVPTFLVGLLGKQSWQIAASSTARVRSGVGSGSQSLCPGAILISTQDFQMGGNNTLTDGVCVHGEVSVHFGGSSYFTEDVRISSFYPDNITIGDVDGDSPAGEDEVAVKEPVHIEPVVLPILNTMFDDLWAALYTSGVSTYSGDLLPEFLKDPATGTANVVQVNQWWWTVQPGDFEPYTIYMVNHGMQMAGKVDGQNIAVIAKGQIGMGGGPRLHFNDVFFFGEGQLNFSGSASYGEPDHYCGSRWAGRARRTGPTASWVRRRSSIRADRSSRRAGSMSRLPRPCISAATRRSRAAGPSSRPISRSCTSTTTSLWCWAARWCSETGAVTPGP